MSDNNINLENVRMNLVNNSDTVIRFLENLAEDYDLQHNAILLQLNECKSLIQLKTQKKSAIDLTQTNNYDLFSPNKNSENNKIQLDSEINDLKKQQEELNRQLEILIEKKSNISSMFLYIDYVRKNSNKHDKDNKDNSYISKGIELLEIQDEERQRIARDLHDSTVQNLTSLVHKTELCLKLIDIDSIRAKLELTTMSNTIKTIIKDMRDIIYNLKPMSLDDLGLIVTVERYAKQIMDINDIKVLVHSNKETKGVLPVVNLTLFRIIQEACCNIIKHAKATLIDININYCEEDITVSIKDNGIGFDYEKHLEKVSEQSSSFGLSIMRERIALLSGTINIQSENGKGTIITISVPVTKCEGEKYE